MGNKKIVLIVFVLFLTSLNILGQDLKNRKTTPPPSEEKFEPAFGRIKESVGLGKRSLDDRRETDTIRIYNADGSFWYEFSFYENSPLFYKNNLKSGFKPMGALLMDRMPNFGIILTLKAESENWYEVVVNEETRATKYTWKGDPILGRDTWENYIPQSVFITFDKKKNPLRKSPNGEIMVVQMPDAQKFFRPTTIRNEIKGEWLYVWTGWSKFVKEPIGGWIKWKEGNELLIKFWTYYENDSSEFSSEKNDQN